MSGADSFDGIVARLRAGDEDAAAEVYRRFTGRLIRLAYGWLDSRMRQKMDPEDVTQSVFRTFFLRQAKGQFDLQDWDSLWRLLVRITFRKCGRRIAAFHTDHRDVRLEVRSLVSDEQSRRALQVMARDPAPLEVAACTETLEHLMDGLDEKQQQVVVLRLQGYTIAEISQLIGRTKRTVHRALREVRDKLKQLESEASS